MSKEEWYLKVGKYKGEWDFSVGGLIGWTFEDMQDFRAMCMTAIGIAEEQFRHNQEAINQIHMAVEAPPERIKSNE